jgi:hypothetical protein
VKNNTSVSHIIWQTKLSFSIATYCYVATILVARPFNFPRIHDHTETHHTR